MSTPWYPHTPKCRKCGKPCAYYGSIGGYSVQCIKCNAAQAKKRRANYAKNHGAKP